jgi:hypothetical protein
MAQVKKTAKYYRDILSGDNISAALKVLPEVIKKFGYKRWETAKEGGIINLKKYTEFEWNHQIEGFFLTDKGVPCVDIYWQGDSTDGNNSLYVRECVNGYTIPAERVPGDRTYYKHSDIRISRDEFSAALKAVAKYLSPEAIKERKIAAKRGELDKKVFAFIDSKKKDLDRWEMGDFWNGRMAVQRLLEKEPGLLDKTWEEIEPIISQVYKKNNKTIYSYGGSKEYDLTYQVATA